MIVLTVYYLITNQSTTLAPCTNLFYSAGWDHARGQHFILGAPTGARTAAWTTLIPQEPLLLLLQLLEVGQELLVSGHWAKQLIWLKYCLLPGRNRLPIEGPLCGPAL